MTSTTILIRRLSSITLLKIMLITFLFPWILIDTGVILFHLLSGDLVVNVTQVISGESIEKSVPIGKFVLISYSAILIGGVIFIIMLWGPCAFSLWLWSKIRPLEIRYYEDKQKEL